MNAMGNSLSACNLIIITANIDFANKLFTKNKIVNFAVLFKEPDSRTFGQLKTTC